MPGNTLIGVTKHAPGGATDLGEAPYPSDQIAGPHHPPAPQALTRPGRANAMGPTRPMCEMTYVHNGLNL